MMMVLDCNLGTSSSPRTQAGFSVKENLMVVYPSHIIPTSWAKLAVKDSGVDIPRFW